VYFTYAAPDCGNSRPHVFVAENKTLLYTDNNKTHTIIEHRFIVLFVYQGGILGLIQTMYTVSTKSKFLFHLKHSSQIHVKLGM